MIIAFVERTVLMKWIAEDIEEYIERNTESPPQIFRELEMKTREECQHPEMQVGRVEGTLLRMLVSLTGARSILELGTFTGYSAMMMASTLPRGGVVYTVERDEQRAEMARSFFDRIEYGNRIEILLRDAEEVLSDIEIEIDFAFIDADKEKYPIYYQSIMDMLVPGGLIVLDNMLWDGEVIDPNDDMAKALDELNEWITEDPRVENVLIPLRDGIMLARKKV